MSAEDETTSRETYTVNSVPVSVERHTPRHFDGIQRPTVNTPPTDQQLTPRSAGKKRRLDHPDVEEWPQQYYGVCVCADICAFQWFMYVCVVTPTYVCMYVQVRVHMCAQWISYCTCIFSCGLSIYV